MSDNYLSNAGRLDWPGETAIDATARNGECSEPVYMLNGVQYRINPVTSYALYWHKGTWRESQNITNNMVRINGVLV